MAIVGEPYNVDAHAKIIGLFLNIFWAFFYFIVKTPTQLQHNLNPTVVGGWTRKWLWTPPTHHTNSKSVISQLLLTRFEPNFKGRFLGPYWTDFNCSSNICKGNICPGDICPYQEYLSSYWIDFDKTLKVGSSDYLEQILTVAATFVQAIFVQTTFVHIRNISWNLSISRISHLLLTEFWRNFKGMFWWLFWTDFNCCSNICPGNICQDDICP